MKRVFLAIVLAVLLLCGTAFAGGALGSGNKIVRSSELSAFMNNDGYIYISGRQTPINTAKASGIISIDAYRIVFLTESNTLDSIELDTEKETAVAADVYAACVLNDNVFYVLNTDRYSLVQYDFDTTSGKKVFKTTEMIDVIYATLNGVVVTTVENSGAFLFDPAANTAITYSGAVAQESRLCEEFQVYSTSNGVLYAVRSGAFFPTTIDSNVQSWTVIGNDIYYTTGNGQTLTLKGFSITSGTSREIVKLGADYDSQVTASQSKLFVLKRDNTINTVDVNNGAMKKFTSLAALSSYSMSNGEVLTGYRLEAVSGQLIVYGVVGNDNLTPTFSFVDFTNASSNVSTEKTMLLCAYKIDGESTVQDLLQPVSGNFETGTESSAAVVLTTLRKGSRGEAVADIQDPLYEHGYYNYKIDGIFGWRTERAVRLLQEQLGLRVTGTANASLQQRIISNNIPDYDPYFGIQRGCIGPHVLSLQERLRELGYLADDADSIFGVRTEKAVRLFQSENGLSETGIADSRTQKLLYSDDAELCSSYIDLERGDSGWRVLELNERLSELYYLSARPGSVYTSDTAEAVRRFQQEIGMRATGRATVAVQQRLFARSAPEYPGYITLSRGDNNTRVKEMQKRLKQLGYYDGRLDSYFGKGTEEAVRRFQRQMGIRVTGIADPQTLSALFDPNAPHYVVYQDITEPIIELSSYTGIDDDGCYLITDNDTVSGGLTVSYFAYGDVDSYDVRIVDAMGTVCLEQEYTSNTIISIPVNYLKTDMVYTLAVTVHPIDENKYSDTYGQLSFKYTQTPVEPDPGEIGTIDSLLIAPDTTTDYAQENGIYIMKPEGMVFKWNAVGDVAGYTYEITDENDNVIISDPEISMNMGVDATKIEPKADVIYILTVYAIPTNGTIDNAVSDSLYFRAKTEEDTLLEEAIAEIEKQNLSVSGEEIEVPAPYVVPNDGMTETVFDGRTVNAYVITESTAAISWMAQENVNYTIQVVDTEGKQVFNIQDTSGDLQIPVDLLIPGKTYRVLVIASDGIGYEAIGDCFAAVPGGETMPAESIDEEKAEQAIEAPVITIDPFEGTFIAEFNGNEVTVKEPGAGNFIVSWQAEGEVGTYSVLITDSNGNVRADKMTSESSGGFSTNQLEAGLVYCIDVTAYSSDGSSSRKACEYFGIRLMEKEDTENAEQTEENQEVIESEEKQGEEDPVPEPEQSIGNAVITVSPVNTVFTADFNGMTVNAAEPAGDGFQISWSVDGNAATYAVNVSDDSGNVLVDTTTPNTSVTFSMQQIQPGVVYRIEIIPYTQNGTSGEASCEYFGIQLDQENSSSEFDTELYAESEDLPTVTEDVSPQSVGMPVIAIEPVDGYFYDSFGGDEVSVTEPSKGAFTINWPAEGDVGSYVVRVLDSNGNIQLDTVTGGSGGNFSTEYLAEGMIYCIEVTAVSEDETARASAVDYFGIKEEIIEPVVAEADEYNAVDYSDNADTVDDYYSDNSDGSQVELYSEDYSDELSEDYSVDSAEDYSESDTEDNYEENYEDNYEENYEDNYEENYENNSAETNTGVIDIATVQMQLVNFGYLEAGMYENGVLDGATLNALIAFQRDYGLVECPLEAPYVSDETIMALGLM